MDHCHPELGAEQGPAPNGRIYSNFLSPGSGETFQQTATSPQIQQHLTENIGKFLVKVKVSELTPHTLLHEYKL